MEISRTSNLKKIKLINNILYYKIMEEKIDEKYN